jgi:dihydrofolate reductase
MSAPAELHVIAAVAANGVIGRGGQLPWHLPDDLKHFKQLTLNHAVIMGRRTYESIGRPLPQRRSIVVSRSLSKAPHPQVELAASLHHAIHMTQDIAFVIGGAMLYAEAIPRAAILHLTELDEAVEGDTSFPPFDRSGWRAVEELHHPRDDRHALAFTFRTYRRYP